MARTIRQLPPSSWSRTQARREGYDVHTIHYSFNKAWDEHYLALRNHINKFVTRKPKRGDVITLKWRLTGKKRKYRVWDVEGSKIHTIWVGRTKPTKRTKKVIVRRPSKQASNNRDQNRRLAAALRRAT